MHSPNLQKGPLLATKWDKIATPHPNLPKGPQIVTKWAKSEVFVVGLRGMRFKKLIF